MPDAKYATGLDAASIFPAFPEVFSRANVVANWPYVRGALVAAGLGDRAMVLVACGTIRAETGSFKPLDEGQSKWNTAPGGPPFGLYDGRAALGNNRPGDGARFKGRGFIQLTGRANYASIGAAVGVDLINDPDQANNPATAAKILAAFMKRVETRMRAAIEIDDLAAARKLVNGGSHGLDAFTAAYRALDQSLPAE